MTAPTLLAATLHKSWFGTLYNALSPFAHATTSLDSVILDREGLLAQLPYIGALAAFAVVGGVFAACSVSLLERDSPRWMDASSSSPGRPVRDTLARGTGRDDRG